MNVKIGRVIKLPAETKAEFIKSFMKKDGTNKSAHIRNVNIPVFNGQTYDNDGRGHNMGALVINFDVMSNYFGKSKYLGSAGPDDADLAGLSYEQIKEKFSPVYVEEFTDLTKANNAEMVRISIDPNALAAANYAERVEHRKEGGPEPNPYTKGKLAMRFTRSTMNKGVASMSIYSFSKSVAEFARQRYILMSNQKDPSRNVVSNVDIATVGMLYANEYNKFAKKAIEDGCEGIHPMMLKNGEFVEDKSRIIEGTKFEPLSKLGLKQVCVDNVAVIGGEVNKLDRSNVNKVLAAFNMAFNAHMSQLINSDDRLSADAKTLGNMMGVNAYLTMPPHPVTGEKNIVTVQPSAVADIQPFNGSLLKAYDAAMHDGPGGVTKTLEELYGKEILENVNKMRYPDDGPPGGGANGPSAKVCDEEQDPTETKSVQTKMYDAVADMLGPQAAQDDIDLRILY